MRHFITIFIVLFSLQAYGGDNRWSSNGPFGGYVLTFAFDPQNANTVYASGSDTIYRSRNAGQLWEHLNVSGTDGFPAAFSVRFIPHGSAMLAAGTSVFTSANQGTQWQQVAQSPANGDQFYDVEFSPSNPSVVYGVTYRHGFFRSNDGGNTWAAKNSGLNINPKASCCDFPQVEVDPTNGNTVYALLSSRILYKSTNGGDSWKTLNGVHFGQAVNSLAIDTRNPQVLYAGGFEGIFKTVNGGTSWTGTNCACGVFSIALDPKNTQTIYAVSDVAIKSTNGGGSWITLPAPIPRGGSWLGIGVSPKNSAIFAGGFGTGIFRSLDGGRTWKEFLNRIDGNFISKIASSPQKPTQAFGISPPLAYVSSNNGGTWSLIKSLAIEPRALAVHPANPNLLAAAGDPSGVAVSNDGGKTWAYKSQFHDVREDCTACIQFHSQDQNTIYLAPLGAGMARSNNRGDSFSLINAGLSDKNVTLIAVDPKNGANVFAATSSGKIFKSSNGGGSWKLSSSGIQSGYAFAMAFDPNNSNTMYASLFHEPNKGSVYKSTNGGQNWIQKNNGLSPLYAIRGFAVDPLSSSTVFAVGEAGVFVSANGGDNWSAFDSTGLNPFYIFDILINPAQASTLWIGTNHGIFSYTRKTGGGGVSIDQISPASAKVGDSVNILGQHFGGSQGSGSVSFNGTSGGTASAWSDGSISIRVPSGAHSGPVAVTANGARSNSFGFTVLPASGNVEPSSGSSAGGTMVTVLGPPARSGAAIAVLFGETVAAGARFTPPNIYTCISPPGTGTVDVILVSGLNIAKMGTFTYQ